MVGDTPQAGVDRTKFAILSLRISEVIYLLLIILFALFPYVFPDVLDRYDIFSLVCAGVCTVPFLIFLEVVAQSLKRKKFWAWVAGIAVFGIYIMSLFLPLGILGLWGLLSEGSRKAFGIGR